MLVAACGTVDDMYPTQGICYDNGIDQTPLNHR